jgi:concentrative nucleoside transporter, CNT family
MQSLQSALGVVAIVAIAFLISENRRAVPWRSVIIGLILTFALALLMLKIPQAETVFGWINRAVEVVAAATKAGTTFVFGYIGGGAPPFDPKTPGSDFILAFQALPVVLVMSVLSSLLFYWRILPPIVRGFSWALERTLESAARPASRPQPTSLSAKSRRRCSSGLISPSCRAVKCSS